MNFNITRVRPKGFLHVSAFSEVMDSLAWSLTQLGHNVMLTENTFSSGAAINIIFGAECLPEGAEVPPNSIIYNLEQWTHPNIRNVISLARGKTVWDYSLRNIERWKVAGLDCRHVPIGYVPILSRIPNDPNKEWDFCFFGWLTPRRLGMIQKLRGVGIRVFVSDRAYGGFRDNIVSRSKAVLNIHHDGRSQFEIVRVSYMLANGKYVISESSEDDSEYSYLTEGLIITSYSQMVDTCQEFLSRAL